MIQRIQSIYLLLCALGFGGLFLTNFATIVQPAEGIWSDGAFSVTDNTALIAMAVLGTGLSVATIFLYKHRPLQTKLTAFLIILAGLIMATGFYLLNQTGTEGYAFDLGWVFPVFAAFFSVMAGVFIRRDEKTVRSMDRLR